MSDRREIRDLVARYADAVCRRDQAAWADTWAEDGLWQLPSAPETRGRDNIVALWAGAMAGFPFVAQLVHNGTVEVDGDSATGRWYLTEHLKFAQGGGMFNIGVYQDRYVKTAAGWKFAERHYSVLYNDKGTGDMSGDVNPFPALKW
ncbi:MAG: nuclear transport factor 2 family protein [Pseudomonadales bacterium]